MLDRELSQSLIWILQRRRARLDCALRTSCHHNTKSRAWITAATIESCSSLFHHRVVGFFVLGHGPRERRSSGSSVWAYKFTVSIHGPLNFIVWQRGSKDWQRFYVRRDRSLVQLVDSVGLDRRRRCSMGLSNTQNGPIISC
jgi:hypothetical protein